MESIPLTRLISYLDVFLACKPYMRSLVLTVDHINIEHIYNTIFIQKNTLSDLILSQICTFAFSFLYATCSNSTLISADHMNTLLTIVSENQMLISTDLVFKHPISIFKPVYIPNVVDEICDIMQDVIALCKLIFLDCMSILDATKRQDYKYLKLNSKQTRLDLIGPHISRLFAVFGIVHSYLLSYLRGDHFFIPGVIETIFLCSLTSPSLSINTKGFTGDRNKQCSLLVQRMCSSVVALTFDTKTIQLLWIARFKMTKNINSPAIDSAKYSGASFEEFLLSSKPTRNTSLLEFTLESIISCPVLPMDISIEMSNPWDLNSLIEKSTTVSFIFQCLHSLSQAKYGILQTPLSSRLSKTSTNGKELEITYASLNLSSREIPSIIAPHSVLFWVVQICFNFLTNKIKTIDDLLFPSSKDTIESLRRQQTALLNRSRRQGIDLSMKLTLAADQAKLEAHSHSLENQLKYKTDFVAGDMISRRNLILQRLNPSLFTEDQIAHDVSVIWGAYLRIKSERDLLRKQSESTSIEAALHDSASIRQSAVHLKDVFIQKGIDAKHNSKKRSDEMDRERQHIRSILIEKKLLEKEEREKKSNIKTESIRIRNALVHERTIKHVQQNNSEVSQRGSADTFAPQIEKINTDASFLNNSNPDYTRFPQLLVSKANIHAQASTTEPRSIQAIATPISIGNSSKITTKIDLESELERMIWATEESRKRREADESKLELQKERKQKAFENSLYKTRLRLERGTFQWHNGRFGYYDNARGENIV